MTTATKRTAIRATATMTTTNKNTKLSTATITITSTQTTTPSTKMLMIYTSPNTRVSFSTFISPTPSEVETINHFKSEAMYKFNLLRTTVVSNIEVTKTTTIKALTTQKKVSVVTRMTSSMKTTFYNARNFVTFFPGMCHFGIYIFCIIPSSNPISNR